METITRPRTIYATDSDWIAFRKLCIDKGSSASKEVDRFIKKTIKDGGQSSDRKKRQ